MKKILIILFLTIIQVATAQELTGVIIDEATGDSIPFASAQYKKERISISSNGAGRFSVVRKNGSYITFSAMGYQPYRMHVDASSRKSYA